MNEGIYSAHGNRVYVIIENAFPDDYYESSNMSGVTVGQLLTGVIAMVTRTRLTRDIKSWEVRCNQDESYSLVESLKRNGYSLDVKSESY